MPSAFFIRGYMSAPSGEQEFSGVLHRGCGMCQCISLREEGAGEFQAAKEASIASS